jgi:hypothetical protein
MCVDYSRAVKQSIKNLWSREVYSDRSFELAPAASVSTTETWLERQDLNLDNETQKLVSYQLDDTPMCWAPIIGRVLPSYALFS